MRAAYFARLLLPRADAARAVELAAAEGSAAAAEPPADLPPAEAACAELRALLKQAEEVFARGKARPLPRRAVTCPVS